MRVNEMSKVDFPCPCQHHPPHGPNCQSEGPRPIPVDFGCSRFTFERSVGFKKFGWAVFEKNDFLKIWVWV